MPGSASLQALTRGKLLHVIARSGATWQSVLSAAGHDRKQYLRRTRKSVYEFARSSASLPSFPAGMRIATPVCALVRNDMQKAGTCARVQGRGARKVCRRQGVSTGARTSPTVIARSGATWQSVLLAVPQNEKEHFGQIRKAQRICPNSSQLARLLCGENGLPHQCAHWFAMTC